MSSYKLTYFNGIGLGEPIRQLLIYGGISFQDERLKSWEEFEQFSSKTPMRQVPVLEIDGKMYHQTRAICRYLAKKFDLYGSDDLQQIAIDASVDDIDDWRAPVVRFFREEDETRKAKLRTVALEKTDFSLGKFEDRVKRNAGYFVGGKMSWADIYFATASESISKLLGQEVLEAYPALKKLYGTVYSVPKIKAYLDKRPETQF